MGGRGSRGGGLAGSPGAAGGERRPGCGRASPCPGAGPSEAVPQRGPGCRGHRRARPRRSLDARGSHVTPPAVGTPRAGPGPALCALAGDTGDLCHRRCTRGPATRRVSGLCQHKARVAVEQLKKGDASPSVEPPASPWLSPAPADPGPAC